MSEEIIKPITNDKTKLGLGILQGALLIGISGDFLLRTTPWGLNAFLWVLLVSIALIALTFSLKREALTKEKIMLHGALLFFAATFLYRASIPLLWLNVLAIFTIAAVLTLPGLKINPKLAGVSHYILGFVWSGINLLVSPILLIFSNVQWKETNKSGWMKTAFPIIRGLLIVAPLLLIFGALFMAADAAFQGMIERALNIEDIRFDEIFSHIFLTIFLTWIVAGYLRGSLFGTLIPDQFSTAKPVSVVPTENVETEPQPKRDWREFNSSWLPNSLNLGTIEISIIWGLMNLLFLSFVLVQLPYLFGGAEYVQNTENVRLADYARRGVAELGLVTILVLPILLIGHWFIRRENKTTQNLFKVLAGIQIGLLFVIMLSSAQRMILYTGNYGYGLTLERFYAMVLLAVLAAIFVWFAATIFLGQRQKFAWGMLWISFVTLGFLNIMNPSEFVLRTNYQLTQQGRDFDGRYNFYDLDADSMPKMIEIISNIDESQKCYAENGLYMKENELKDDERVRNWNYSRWKARNAIKDYKMSKGVKDLEWRDCYKNHP